MYLILGHMIRSILLLVILMPAGLACQKGAEKNEQAQSTHKVFTGDKSALVSKELVESTTWDLVVLMRRNLKHFEAVFGAVKAGMNDCQSTADRIQAYLQDNLDDDKKLYARIKKMQAGLTVEEQKAVSEKGRTMLKDEMQAFEKELQANLELLREFRRKCPKEAEVVREIMQRFMQRVFK